MQIANGAAAGEFERYHDDGPQLPLAAIVGDGEIELQIAEGDHVWNDGPHVGQFNANVDGLKGQRSSA